MLTLNEKKVLHMLLTAFKEEYSINQIARKCKISPNGALKILKKFEKEGILKSKKIANIISYSINFDNEKTKNILELALINNLEGRVKFRYEDLAKLKNVTKACIVFGSYLDLKKEPNDLDVFFVIEKNKFKEYKTKSPLVFKTIPIKVHDILQTEEDLTKNISENDAIIVNILRTGAVFWGGEKIIQLIKNGY